MITCDICGKTFDPDGCIGETCAECCKPNMRTVVKVLDKIGALTRAISQLQTFVAMPGLPDAQIAGSIVFVKAHAADLDQALVQMRDQLDEWIVR